MTVFREKMSTFTPKISDNLFLVIDQVFQISRFFTVLNVVYDPFFSRKTTSSEKNSLIRPFFLLYSCFRAHPRQQKFREMNGAHLASPIRESLVMLIGPTAGNPIYCPIGHQIRGPLGKQDLCPNGSQICVQQFGQL